MPWVRHGDGLRLEGEPHYNEDCIQDLICRLRLARNGPETICNQLEATLLHTRIAEKPMIYRLSKWCHWNDWSEQVARDIASQLFYNIVCRRLWDEHDHPILLNEIPAEEAYRAWLQQVVQAGQAWEPDLAALRAELAARQEEEVRRAQREAEGYWWCQSCGQEFPPTFQQRSICISCEKEAQEERERERAERERKLADFEDRQSSMQEWDSD